MINPQNRPFRRCIYIGPSTRKTSKLQPIDVSEIGYGQTGFAYSDYSKGMWTFVADGANANLIVKKSHLKFV